MKITLCLLTFNELSGCQNDVPEIKKLNDHFNEIYAIDGGSTDGTIEYLKEQGIPVYIQPEKGLNAACHYGVKKCTSDAIVFFHPKGTIPVSDTLKFREFFENGFGFVIGSRNIKGARNEEDNNIIRPRKWFVETLALIAAILFKHDGIFIRDVLHGFRGATIDAYKKMSLADKGKVTIDIEMVSRAYKMRIPRTEFPTTESSRLAGETNFKAWPTGKSLLRYILSETQRRD